MLQKYLARSARTFAAQTFESRVPQAARQSFRVTQTSNARAVFGMRSYSASTEATKDEAAAEKGEAKEEDPVQKELAAKKKEVAEVTVRVEARERLKAKDTEIWHIGQVQASGRRVPQSPGADKA